jgi:voltage-gated potassium channel
MKLIQTISNLSRRRLLSACVAIFLAIIVGATGFFLIEGLSPLDSIYLATETVTTVGYGDVTPKSMFGRVFAVAFMLIGGGTVLYALTVLAQSVIQSEIIEALGIRQKEREMEKLRNHYIVCGAGRVGRRIIRSLQKEKHSFVIIEKDAQKIAEFEEENLQIIVGDATLEENLLKAGIKHARGLASCLPDDADNVYVVLTARGLNETMHIVARAVEEQAEPKLIRAGANRVVAPTIIGSLAMARSLLKPAIADFMHSIVAETLDLVFEEIAIKQNSTYAGKQLKETNISTELNLLVVAIRRENGEMIYQPSAETLIQAGDLLIVIGIAEKMKKLVEISK